MTRSERDKKLLKETAKDMIAGDDGVELALEETTGEEDFKYEKSPNVCGVVVDKGSGLGYAQITGGGKEPRIIYTGRGESGCVKAEILAGQTCMLYGRSTVLYILPRST
ncbi:hypothetical protein ACJ73_08491 [Blastomyces percursus]|uniref:Uncharacterized protein n=1 Tax=Blastomyces percursus TaxID=1658174 RepID=A0A1J9PUW2_9EURO|nr:hypothetical protein ACJ73_08491 [Blastomyces percursus]